MTAYHQMGYDSENIVLEPELGRFGGAIVSPVNCAFDRMSTQCARLRAEKPAIEILFDPQLYIPQSERGKLGTWPHMPEDLDTADLGSLTWWATVVDRVLRAAQTFLPQGICSPAPLPRAYDDLYYEMLVEIGNDLVAKTSSTNVRPVLTGLVGLQDLSRQDRYLQVASVLSRFRGRQIYLVFEDDTSPRLERSDSAALEAACRLIRLLATARFEVIVAFTSSEMVLWKAAGAQHVASGKFFNLRRFTRNRWNDDPNQGGRNVPYWFEPEMLGFLREADLVRIRREVPLSALHANNPFSRAILGVLEGDYRPWLADSWRQFLWWFAESEATLGNAPTAALAMIEGAKGRWQQVKEIGIELEEEHNDGAWLRSWEIALKELTRRPD